MILFALSAMMLLLTAGLSVRWAAAGVRFWVFLAAVNLHLTLGHILTSVFHALTPIGFLVSQAAMLALVLLAGRVISKRTGAVSRFPRPGIALLRWAGWRSPVCVVLAISVCAALILSLTEQMLRPVTGFDERMYNCSRVLYWIQHGHIWPWVTHNDAQIDFPIGAEVFFSWPILFTKTEWVGRLVFWMGYPAALAGTYLLTRMLQASRAGAVAAALAFAMTPTVLYMAGINQKQDIWTAAMLLGVAYWVVRCWKSGGGFNAAMLGVYFVLAVNVKITCLAVAPLVALAVVVPHWRGWRDTKALVGRLTVGALATLVASGLGITLVQNAVRYGHPLGPPAAAKVVAPDWSIRQVYTHAVRAPLQLFELPTHPSEDFRRWWVEAGSEIVYRLDAHRALPGERVGAWPGWFRIDAGPPHDARAYRFSTGGMVWLAAVVWAVFALAIGVVRRGFRYQPAPSIIALAVSGILFLALVFMLRWVWGAPERYWVGPYAVGLAAACACIAGWAKRRWVAMVLLLMLAATVYPSFESIVIRLRDLQRQPIAEAVADEPFAEIVTKLPPGSTVLLFGNRNARDYPLFLPRQGYANRVIPWGRARFDPERLERMIRKQGVTHAVFEAGDRLGFHWHPGLRVTWMVEWFRTRPNFREMPLVTTRQRMFERTDRP